jgi:hypothetical protein
VDRHGQKLGKGKMHIVSAALLPMRRLLLLGGLDGTIKVIS